MTTKANTTLLSAMEISKKTGHKLDAVIWVDHLLKNKDTEGLIEMAEHCLEDGRIPDWAIQRESIYGYAPKK